MDLDRLFRIIIITVSFVFIVIFFLTYGNLIGTIKWAY